MPQKVCISILSHERVKTIQSYKYHKRALYPNFPTTESYILCQSALCLRQLRLCFWDSSVVVYIPHRVLYSPLSLRQLSQSALCLGQLRQHFWDGSVFEYIPRRVVEHVNKNSGTYTKIIYIQRQGSRGYVVETLLFLHTSRKELGIYTKTVECIQKQNTYNNRAVESMFVRRVSFAYMYISQIEFCISHMELCISHIELCIYPT